jgi:hypothetical protein
MKPYIFFIGIAFVITACPSGNGRQSDLKRIQENNMDLPDLYTESFEGIDFQLSELFKKDYQNDHTLKGSSAFCKKIRGIDTHFTLEVFDDYDVNQFTEEFEDSDGQLNPLDVVHDYYILKRHESLSNPGLSIKKILPKRVKQKGYIQIVEGSKYASGTGSTYFTATIEIKGEYYVFQLIGVADNMGYLYDDFLDILASVK